MVILIFNYIKLIFKTIIYHYKLQLIKNLILSITNERISRRSWPKFLIIRGAKSKFVLNSAKSRRKRSEEGKLKLSLSSLARGNWYWKPKSSSSTSYRIILRKRINTLPPLKI